MNNANQESDKNYPTEIENSDIVVAECAENQTAEFKSTFGIVFACLGSVIGFGNIWRFPRILANYSYDHGPLIFYLVWFFVLYLWSVPLLIVEYSLGRFTKNSLVASFCKFFGDQYAWLGGWVILVTFFLSSYYSVILGWCIYYTFVSCFIGLPRNNIEGENMFYEFSNSYWPLFTQFLAIFFAVVCIYGGIKWIEKTNNVLVPCLLGIIVFTCGWSLTRQYAEIGIKFLFTPTWKSLADPALWIAAFSQNAFDTGAGTACLATYGAFMNRNNGVVKYGTLIPVLNNFISFIGSITIFSTVFSTLIQTHPTLTRSGIVRIMTETGPGSTGLTFVWIPVLFNNFGEFGRLLCIMFFTCLVFAGLSSLISNIQVFVVTLDDTGLKHKISVVITTVALLLVGSASALNLRFLTNQDNVWGIALLISGLLLALLVIYYGPFKYRNIIVNDFGIGDWHLPKIWSYIIIFFVPLEGIVLICWWLYDVIAIDPEWYKITYKSAGSIFLEWFLALFGLVSINMLAIKFKWTFFPIARNCGFNPHKHNNFNENRNSYDKYICHDMNNKDQTMEFSNL